MSPRFWLVLLLSFTSVALAQESRYFPRLGPRSAAEEIRELQNPGVILTIALCPGSEDLPSIAESRIGSGASVGVAFVTNGEDIPSDLNGETFYMLAARRKEEAYKALSQLGVQSYFLNMPVDDFPPGKGRLKPDRAGVANLTARLDSVIDREMPDVIVIDRDPLYGGRPSPRLNYLEKVVLADVRERNSSGLKWHVSRVLMETSGDGSHLPVNEIDRVWSESYSQMAASAQQSYHSLKFNLPLWNKDRSHTYVEIYPGLSDAPIPFTRGLPEIDASLRQIAAHVKSVSEIERMADLNERLEILRNAISWVDSFISTSGNKSSVADQRILSTWKFGLEKLRCTELAVDVRFNVSDTVLTQLQLFYLRFGKINSRVGAKGLQILFPGVVEKKWIVNERQNQFYPLHPNDRFRVVTMRLPFNSAESPEGFSALQNRTEFEFMIIHHDDNAAHNFLYRVGVPLTIAPIRAIQVLTPQIAALRDSTVVVRLKSNSRDTAQGIIYVHSPLVSSPAVKVDLKGKDFVEIDTLHLKWKDTTLTGARMIDLFAAGNEPVGAFYARYIEVKSDPEDSVGFFSDIVESPLEIGLRRLGLNPVDFKLNPAWENDLSRYTAIVVDQFSFDDFIRAAGSRDELEKWIDSGGRLLIMAQYGTSIKEIVPGEPFNYVYSPVIGADEGISIDSTNRILDYPNKLSEKELGTSQFPVAFGRITAPAPSKVLIASKDGAPLLVEQNEGRGGILYCTLNLLPRLIAVDQTAYQLLANLLTR